MKNKIQDKKPLIGFIGQGFIGKNYADDFERRGYQVVRYSMEDPHIKNKGKIKSCDIVFIAVPTPTTPGGFVYSLVEDVISLVGKGKIAVIKSTVLPGTTEAIQKKYQDKIVMHAPEFLSEATAARDAAFPDRNIIGITKFSPIQKKAARLVLSTLPRAPYDLITGAKEAELIKYGRNTLGFVRIVFVNLLFDLANAVGADWSVIQEAMSADPDNGSTYMRPLHKSGRGAGGHCFIKDFAALKTFFQSELEDPHGLLVFEALEKKNNELLLKSKKDLDLLEGVYGKRMIK